MLKPRHRRSPPSCMPAGSAPPGTSRTTPLAEIGADAVIVGQPRVTVPGHRIHSANVVALVLGDEFLRTIASWGERMSEPSFTVLSVGAVHLLYDMQPTDPRHARYMEHRSPRPESRTRVHALARGTKLSKTLRPGRYNRRRVSRSTTGRSVPGPPAGSPHERSLRGVPPAHRLAPARDWRTDHRCR